MTARHLILLAFIALCLPYAFATPVFEKNDESEHFAVAWHIAQGGGLPVQQPGLETPWAQEGSQPPLYYLLASLPLRLFDVRDFEAQLVPNATPQYAPFAPNNKNRYVITPNKRTFSYSGAALAAVVLRLLNIVPGAVTVWCAYVVAHALGKSNSIALVGMALTAFNPMFLTLTTAVSNDALVIALVTVALALLLRNLREGWSLRKAVVVGLLLGCASLTKLSGALLLPVALLSIYLAQAPAHKPGFFKKTGLCAGYAAALTLAWATIAGWWFIRNALLYGELTGTRMMAQMASPRSVSLLTALSEFQGFRWSYLGIFGQFTIAMHRYVYLVWDVFLVGCVAGVALAVWRSRLSSFAEKRSLRAAWSGETEKVDWLGVALVGFAILLVFAAMLRWTMMVAASHGRLLFPCIAGVSALMAIGIREIGDWRFSMFGRFSVSNLQSLIAILSASLATLIPFFTIAPSYAPPLVAQMPSDAIATQQTLAPYAQIIGYRMAPSQVRPGEAVQVQVFTRALTPTQFSYLLVAKLYGPDTQELTRFSTYSGNGLWPSNFWRAGDVMRDDIEFTLPFTAPASGILRVQFELYNPGSGDIVQSVDAQGKAGAPLYDGATLLLSAPPTTNKPALASFGNFAQLVGYGLLSRTNGQAIQLDWQPLAAADKDYTVFVQVVNLDDSPALQSDGPPLQGNFPTTRWAQSAIFADAHPITLPPNFKPGDYRLLVGFYDPATGARVEARDAKGERLKNDAFEGKLKIKTPDP
jgi:4-amino-4-deoxy-L-arabinose transferase-like glycosyltransferase